jgi:uncharacterized membrane protein YecN with MAPEG domain
MLIVTSLVAAVLTIIFVRLSFAVIALRRKNKVPLGTGGNVDLERAIRAQGNFAEYVPFTLLLIAFAEMRGINPIAIHLLCVALLIGRTCHAWGVSNNTENFRFRVIGMGFTLNTIAAAALANVASYFL